MSNPSGIYPKGDRILIRPDEIERVSEGGIILVDETVEQHGLAQTIGVIVEMGPACGIDTVEMDEAGDVTRSWGKEEPYAHEGDRVLFAKYGGIQIKGRDDKTYRVMRHDDITAVVDDDLDVTDLKPRKPVGA